MKGYNITFIAALFALAFSQLLGPRRAYWLTITGIAHYVLLVGADVPERLATQGGATVLRTDTAGTIEFTTDGQTLWV